MVAVVREESRWTAGARVCRKTRQFVLFCRTSPLSTDAVGIVESWLINPSNR